MPNFAIFLGQFGHKMFKISNIAIFTPKIAPHDMTLFWSGMLSIESQPVI